MSEDEINRAIREAQEYEAQDRKRKEAVDTRNEADAFVFQTEKALKDVGDKLDAASKATVEADLAKLKELLEKTNPENITDSELADIKAAKEKLMTDSQALFAKLYENINAAGGAGPDMSQGGSAGPNDDVVDGDYREL